MSIILGQPRFKAFNAITELLESGKVVKIIPDISVSKSDLDDWTTKHFGKVLETTRDTTTLSAIIDKEGRDWKPFIAIDLDGTLAKPLESYDGLRIGDPIKGPFFDKVKQAVADGLPIRILTARVAYDKDGKIADAIKAWTLKYLGKELPVTNEKDPGMTEIWDDRAHTPDEIIKAEQSVMVAFTIDLKTAEKLKVEDGEDVSEMHVTLVYIPTIEEDKINALKTMLKGFAGTFAPVDATLRGPTRFSATKHSDGKDVCVANVESLTLAKFREDLLNKVESLGIEVAKNFSYNPHVTLKYIETSDDLPVQRIDPIEVTFKTITLYDQGDLTDFPLSGTAVAKHVWITRKQGGSPDAIESYERVTYCEKCGDEYSEENETQCLVEKSSGFGTIIECVSEGNLMWAHVTCDDGNRVALQFDYNVIVDNARSPQVGDHVQWNEDNLTLDDGEEFPLINISKATGSKEGTWVTINGQHILVGSDGKPLSGNPKVLGQRNVSAKVEIARKNAVLTGKHEQDIADRGEKKLAAVLGIPRTKNNSAFDLRNGDVGIEVKTMVTGKNDKITMGKTALGRKLAEQRAEGLKVFTVVADMRGRTQAKYFVKEGVGSFRVGSMHPINLSDLKELVTR